MWSQLQWVQLVGWNQECRYGQVRARGLWVIQMGLQVVFKVDGFRSHSSISVKKTLKHSSSTLSHTCRWVIFYFFPFVLMPLSEECLLIYPNPYRSLLIIFRRQFTLLCQWNFLQNLTYNIKAGLPRVDGIVHPIIRAWETRLTFSYDSIRGSGVSASV